MLSDEEKKAIEILKDREYDFDELYCTFRQSFIKPYDKSIGIILELIEKQSKEIEDLNKSDASKEQSSMNYYNLYKELVDKIKAKIEYYENKIKKIRSKKLINEPEDTIVITRYAHYISVLQSLLEKE